ncbi:penicillin-binding protein 2 [Microbacterium esteraromaticum]|uniref:peptidoglycan D,D-transpeptidase FtsI family protein n=1 Tax=Microbacterium esteraromaticum TaxID=57043 RepID=UPI001C94B57D|nr:penicillin-binding protein 2 [Microbacterium esteraromaticum]MBY6062324.1 penicillin-binding protein 2 [Microbacterium esteraromaticum]
MTTRATRGPRRRTVVALAVILMVLAAFIFRLVDIQIVHADEHVAQGVNDGNLGTTRSIEGTRGDIVDDHGTVLASSVLVYDAELSPLVIDQIENNPKNKPKTPWAEASERIAQITGDDGAELRAAVEARLAENPESQYLPFAEGLNTEQYLELRELDLVYLHMIPRSVRVYPNGAVAGSAVGFLNGSGEAQYGIERMQDQCLSATDGEVTYLRGQGGVKIPGSERTTPAVDGGTVQLTIDSDLNWYLQQMIAEEAKKQGAQAGSVTVVEIATGKIRAMAEYPTVDPNDIDSAPQKYWMSQIFADAYEPGSTFKPITAAMVIDQGAATPLSTVTAPSREVFPNGAVVNDPFYHPVYDYTFAGALIDSSNVSMSKFGAKVSAQSRYDYLQRFGVGSATGVGFPAEQQGLIHDPNTWDNQTLYTTTFGQAFTVTPAQIAGAYQALGNGGRKLPLSLVESCTMADGTVVKPDVPEPEQIVSEQTADQVNRMLENVAVQGGLASAVEVPGYRIGMKTGTAQKPDGNGGYKPGIYFTNMAGIAPIEDPQYVVLVTLDEPTKIRTSAATASAFQKAMTQVLKTYKVAPSSQPMDELLPKFD